MRDTGLYLRMAAYIRETPWALDPRVLAALQGLCEAGPRLKRADVARQVGGKQTARPDVHFYSEAGALVGAVGRGQPMARTTTGQAAGSLVAVLVIEGIISHRAIEADEFWGSGGTSVERLRLRFRGLMADPAVKAVVLDVDSPGGSVYGVPELADEIRAARGRKPLEAVSNSLMASAAYYLGSGADRVWSTPSGETGSIGVYAAHVDVSKFLERLGVKTTLVSYGENKVMGNPFEAISDEARADLQKRVNEYGMGFDRAVARSRNVTTDQVRKQMGQGLVFGAREAAVNGLTDGTATLDEVIGRLTRQRGAMEAPAASQRAPERAEALAASVPPSLSPAWAAFARAEREAAARRARIM